MKTKTPWIVIGVIGCGMIAGSPPVHAQAPRLPDASGSTPGAVRDAQSKVKEAPSAVGGDHAPWNRGVATEVREAAREVFLEGNRLFRIPLFAQAIEKYNEALGKWRHPAFYFNLALAQLNLGLDVEAHGSLELAMQHGAEPLGTEEYREAKEQLVELERRLSRLRITCPTPDAEVTLDGVTLFSGPGTHEVWVKPQAHEITAKRSEYVTKVKRVATTPGSLQTLDLPLRKMIEDRPWAVWKPWAVVGAGAAIAAAGGVLHAFSARNFRAFDSGFLTLSCAATGCTEQAIHDERPSLSAELRRARLEQKLAVGGYIAGGAALVAGVVLVYLNRPHLAEQEKEDPRGSRIALTPVVSDDSLGLLMTVSR